MTDLRKAQSARHNLTQPVATIEQFSNEILFEIFDYLTGNELCRSFYGVNSRFNELVCNTPNVHLDLSRTKTKLFKTYHEIFNGRNIVSVVLLYENIIIVESLSSSLSGTRVKSLDILDVPFREFENRIPTILNDFKDQLLSLKIQFHDMTWTSPGERAAQSFGFLLTEMSSLKYLTLDYSKGIDLITYMSSTVVNKTIVNLTIRLREIRRLIPLIYRFQKLSELNIYPGIDFESIGKKAAPPQDVFDYRSRINEPIVMEYPGRLRHINLHHCPLTAVERMEKIFQLIVPETLLTLNFFACERPAVKIPIPRRQPPFLDGTHWHDLVRKYLPSTTKRFYIEYQDVDDSMSRTNVTRVKKEFMQYNGSNLSTQLNFSYVKDTRLMSFELNFT